MSQSMINELAKMMSSMYSERQISQILASALKDHATVPEPTIEEYMANAKNTFESAQKRKGQKAPNHSSHDLIVSHVLQREQLLKLRNSKKEAQMINTTIFDVYHSEEVNLDRLNRVCIDDLRMEIWHRGRYLLCRTIEQPYRLNAVSSVVEDETGKVALLSLYNYTKHLTDYAESYLPVDTILAIKEPYLKSAVNGGSIIRCDSPTDVIVINYLDENYKKLNVSSIRNWGRFCAAADNVHKSPAPKSPTEWRTRGNDLYKKGLMLDAVRAYSIGSSLEPNATEKQLLMLNRAAAYLALGKFDNAAKDAVTCLQINPENFKALQRAAKAYYQLRIFELALVFYERAFKIDPSCEKELLNCRQRVKEQRTGEYDWEYLRKVAKSTASINVRLDVADYFSQDIQVTNISSEKGRGIIAKRDIPPGTVVMVSKAFAICFADEVKSLAMNHISIKRKKLNVASQVQLMVSVIHKLVDCPSTGVNLYKLWSGGVDKSNRNNEIIDYDEIERICQYNAFSRGEAAESPEKFEFKSPKMLDYFYSGSGLWIDCSLFNHSCIANTSRWFLGDIMVISTTEFIKKGQELTVHYQPADTKFQDRKEAFSNFGFSCKCQLCMMESTLDHKGLAALASKYKSKISPRVDKQDTSAISSIEKHISSLKKIYSSNSQNAFQFNLIRPMSDLAFLYSLVGKTKKSIDISKELFRAVSNIDDIDAFVAGKELPGNGINFSSCLLMLVERIIIDCQMVGNRKDFKTWSQLLQIYKRFEGEQAS